MSYNTAYIIPFKSISNIDYSVEIQQDGYVGDAIELVGGRNTFVVKIDDEDFLYTPTRFSTAVISIVGSDYLQSLLSTNYQQYRVFLKRENKVIWRGYIRPEMYTQEYADENFELQIECMSAMSTLEFIDYSSIGGYTFISIWDLIKKCVNASNAEYEHVYIPHVYSTDAATYATLVNVLESMTVSEQNFFDEDGEPMKLKEVIEEICKLLNWTCVDYKGDLYFVDIDHTGQYYEYTGDFASYQMVSFSEVNIQNIGFAGSNNTLDILGGYNKASVKTSNYSVGDISKEEKYKDILKQIDDISYNNKVSHKVFYIPTAFAFKQYFRKEPVGGAETTDQMYLDEVYSLEVYKASVDQMFGCVPLKSCWYNLVNGVPDIKDYDFDEVIQIRTGERVWIGQSQYDYIMPSGTKLMTVTYPVAAYSDCALAIKGSVKWLSSSDLTPWNFGKSSNIKFRCVLRIGNYYYNGSAWVNSQSDFLVSFNGAANEWVDIENTKTLSMPYNGLSGRVIEIPTVLKGAMTLEVYAHSVPAYGMFLKNFKIAYQRSDSGEAADRIYENVVNSNYINKLDEIEFKISSYNEDGACYSKVLLANDFLKNNLYSEISGDLIRPEQHLISRVINQYNATKIKLNQILVYSPLLLPASRLIDGYMINKKFVTTGGEIDFESDSFEVKMIEV